MKKILITVLFSGWLGSVMGQSIQRVEYFFDTDPGFGSGITVPITTGSSVTANLDIPLDNSLVNGFHKFNIRAKNANGVWSMVQSQDFFKSNQPTTVQNIVKLEYFIDSDPGFGLANSIGISSGQNITKGLLIPLPQNIPLGFHKFHVRAKDAIGRWSVVYSQSFYKTDELPTVQNIVKLEYFVDTDPGFGLANSIGISSGQNITKGLLIPLPQNLPLGFHKFYVRAKDAIGRWSVVYTQSFYKTDELPTLQNIVKLEYFVDADPGFGLATSVPVSGGTTVNLGNQVFSISGGVTIGDHQLTVRAQDANGKWSIVGIKGFKNCPGVSISAPNGLISCSDSIQLVAQLSNPELGGSLKWFLNNTQLPTTNSSIFAVSSGKYRVERSTTGCLNIPSPTVQANILEGTFIRLKANKPEMLCNESLVISIDSANSNLPIGIPALLSWFRDETTLVANSGQLFQNTNLPGVFKLRMNFSIFPNSCQSFDSDPLTITNRNLELNIGPQTATNILTLCEGSLGTLNSTKNFPEAITYKWFKNNTLLPEESLSTLNLANAPGNYLAKGTFGACVDTPSNSLAVSYAGASNEVPVISAIENLAVTYCGGDTLNLLASGCSGPTLWSINQTGASVKYVTELNTAIFATCQGSCLGSKSNVLNVLGSGYDGNASKVDYALLPFQNEYHSLQKNDFINTYNGAQVVGYKPLFGGGSLTFGTKTGVIFEANNSSNGENDFFIRLHTAVSGSGSYTFLGGSGNEQLGGYLETSPHTYLLYGSSNSPISGNVSQAGFGQNDFWIVKYNYHSSTQIFDKKYGGTASENIVDAALLNNGQMLLAGTSSSGNNGNKSTASFGADDYWVVKIDANGNKLADYSFGGTGGDRLASITKINENLFLLFGTSNSGISGNKSIANINSSNDYWAVWIDASGVIQNQKVFGGNDNEEAVKAILLSSGELVFSGNSNSSISSNKGQTNRGENDFWIIKTDANGIKIWDKTLGGNKNESLVAVNTTIENNLVFFGNTKTITPSFERQKPGFTHTAASEQFHQDTWLIELRQDGSIVTDFIMGSCGEDEAFPVLETEEGDVLTISNVTRSSNCTINYTDISGLDQKYPVVLRLIKAKYRAETTPFCKNSTLFIRAKSPLVNNYIISSTNQRNSYATDFLWTNGQTKRYFKTTLLDGLDTRFKYKLLGEDCFSRISEVQFKRFADTLTLSGVEGSVLNNLPTKQFAYKLLESKRSVISPASYTSEGGIELNPGFKIMATSQNIFEAKIEGCENQY